MARPVTSCGDRIAALASAGTLYLRSNQNVILTRCGLRLDLVDLADRHAADAHVVAGEHAVAVVEVGRPPSFGRSWPVGSHQHDHAGNEQQDQRGRQRIRGVAAPLPARRPPGRGRQLGRLRHG